MGDPQSGLVATSNWNKAGWTWTCRASGTREANRVKLFRDIASAAEFIVPGACVHEKWNRKWAL